MKVFIRVAAIIVRDNALLTHQSQQGGTVYHALPGGHLEAGETTRACLERELHEEFGLEVEIGRLVYVAEGLFIGGRKQPKPKHEIGFYYQVALRDPAVEVRSHEEPRIYARWLPLSQPLEQLFPVWLRALLPTDIAQTWGHGTRQIVADERDLNQPTVQICAL